MTNAKHHNKHHPYLLENDGHIYGAYADLATARNIAKSLGGHWVIRDLTDNVIEEA